MVRTITAIDNQFATASGSNYDSKNGRSDFDTPLDANSNLTITSNAGDDSPYLFELGEAYDLTWENASGTMTMEDGVVVRSDHYFDKSTQGVVVFQGTDQNGDPVQLVWTENLDVHQWYSDNFNGPNPPVFWNTDQDASTYGFICFAADTVIETPKGGICAGDLAVGDMVSTHDNGAQPLRWLGRRTARGTGRGVPVRFETGTVGNAAPLWLSLQHRVLLNSPAVREVTGGEELLVPAKGLVDRLGVEVAPCASIVYVNFLCDAHEIVTTAGGAPCESLYLGPQARASIKEGARDPVADYPDLASVDVAEMSSAKTTARRVLTVRETRELVARLNGAPLVAGDTEAPEVPARALRHGPLGERLRERRGKLLHSAETLLHPSPTAMGDIAMI